MKKTFTLLAIIALSTTVTSQIMTDEVLSNAKTTVVKNQPSDNSTSSSDESKEFADLYKMHNLKKNVVTAEVLTYLLNNEDPREKNTAAIIENGSGCDIILRLVGVENKKIYNLPIAKRTKNKFVIEKGSYTLRANVCDADYYSQKKFSAQPLVLKLANR